MSNPAFTRLAWSNLAAQSAEQISLAAVPMVAVLSARRRCHADRAAVGRAESALAGIAGWVGGDAALKACIVVMAVGFALQALIIVWSPLLRLRALPAGVV